VRFFLHVLPAVRSIIKPSIGRLSRSAPAKWTPFKIPIICTSLAKGVGEYGIPANCQGKQSSWEHCDYGQPLMIEQSNTPTRKRPRPWGECIECPLYQVQCAMHIRPHVRRTLSLCLLVLITGGLVVLFFVLPRYRAW